MEWDWISYMSGIGSSSNGYPQLTPYFSTMTYPDWHDVENYANGQ
jgi:hypothetical protein